MLGSIVCFVVFIFVIILKNTMSLGRAKVRVLRFGRRIMPLVWWVKSCKNDIKTPLDCWLLRWLALYGNWSYYRAALCGWSIM